MGKGGSGRGSYQQQVTWMEQIKARNRRKVGAKASTTRRRRTNWRRTPRRKVLLDNVGSSAREAMEVDPEVMAMVSSTGYSTDAFERDDEWFVNDLERSRGESRKGVRSVKPMAQESSSAGSGGATSAPFAFQNRSARIDWRSLHSVDVDRLIREVDIDTLEMVLDTIAFSDIRGEDTRNFTEDNFVKIFRLAQLMVEYLLHVQELLADHKGELLQSRTVMQQKNEKIRSRFLWQRDALLQTRHELKQAKKTLQTYEVMLKSQGKNQAIQACQRKKQQGRYCPFCEKVFESPYYLDLHVARKHQQKQGVIEDKILAVVSRAEEATAARVKEEMSLVVQAEVQHLRKRYQADLRRTETSSDTQVWTLQEDLRQSNNRLHEVQSRLEVLQAQIQCASSNNARFVSLYASEKSKEKDDGPNQERLYELESKFSGLEYRLKTLGQAISLENSRLLEELDEAYTKVPDLQFAKRQSVLDLENQVGDLRKENQQLKRTITKIEEEAAALTPRERWTREPNKDQALLALARPSSGRRKTEEASAHAHDEPSGQESSADPEHSRHSTSAGKRAPRLLPQEMKYETSSERMMKSYKERPRSVAVKKSKARGEDSPTTVEEMRAKLEKEMAAPHEEQKRRQQAVQRLLAQELVKEKFEARKKGYRTRIENTRSCKPATQYSQTPKLEIPRESIAPLVPPLCKKEENSSPSSSTIHTVREIVSNRAETKRTQAIRPKPSPLGGTRTQSFRSPPLHQSGLGCKRSLPTVHPYLRPGLGNSQTQSRTSFHMAVLNSNPALKSVTHSPVPNYTAGPSKEHFIARLGAVTRELGKYFPPRKPSVEKATSGTVRLVQPTLKPEIETTETEEDDTEQRVAAQDHDKIQEVAEAASMNVGEVAPAMSISEGQKWSKHPSVSILALPLVAEKSPHSATASDEPHLKKANEFDGQLRDELKKFGITSNTNGISDATYNSISSALGIQRSLRISQIHGNDRIIMDYKGGAVGSRTQRAIRERDTAIIESQFDVAPESGSDHLSDANGSENSAGESGRSNYNSNTGHQSHNEDKFDPEFKEDELKPGSASYIGSRKQSSPQNSEVSRSSDSLQEAESNYKKQVVSRAERLSSSNAHGREYFSPRSRPHGGQVQHVSRAFASRPIQKQAKSSRNNRDRPPSRGELIRYTAEFVDNTWHPELDDEVEEDLGLGDWDSDDVAVPPRGEQR